MTTAPACASVGLGGWASRSTSNATGPVARRSAPSNRLRGWLVAPSNRDNRSATAGLSSVVQSTRGRFLRGIADGDGRLTSAETGTSVDGGFWWVAAGGGSGVATWGPRSGCGLSHGNLSMKAANRSRPLAFQAPRRLQLESAQPMSSYANTITTRLHRSRCSRAGAVCVRQPSARSLGRADR
jgi:hypothetical protein